MKPRALRLLTFTFFILLSGCAERQNPATSSSENSLLFISRTPVRGRAVGVAVVRHTAYVADRGFGISIYDLTDPSHPHLVDSIAAVTPFDLRYLAVDPTARLACIQGNNNLELYNLQNRSPIPVLYTGSTSHVKFQLRYNGNGDTLKVFRTDRNEADGFFAEYFPNDGTASNPVFHDEPAFSSNYITRAYGFALGDSNRAWVALDLLGVALVDYTSPGTSPTVVNLVNTPGATLDAALAGDYLYLASGYDGLVVLDVSNKTQPILIGSLLFNNSPNIERIVVQGDTAYLLDVYDGVYAVDITHPANPLQIGNISASTAVDFAVSGDLIVIADEDEGLIVGQILY